MDFIVITNVFLIPLIYYLQHLWDQCNEKIYGHLIVYIPLSKNHENTS